MTEERSEKATEVTFLLSFCKVCEKGRVPAALARVWWQRSDASA